MSNKVNITYYKAQMFFTGNMLNSYELNMLDDVCHLKDPETIIETLKVLTDYEKRQEHLPHTINGYGTYNTVPRSMLSDMLNIEEKSITNKVCFYKHTINKIGTVRLEEPDGTPLPRKTRDRLISALGAFRHAFLMRSILSGFVTEEGIRYKFFTASSAQLKEGSSYYLREDCYEEHKKQFWGDLNPDQINENTNYKGTVMTKLLQYRALLTSSAVPFSAVYGEKMSIRKAICIPEITKFMTADVLSINNEYKTWKGERKDINNSMFDGLALVNAKKFGYIAFQGRMFAQKFCSVSVDVEQYAKHKGYDKNPECYIIKDIDGVSHDLLHDDWDIILSTSVFKMSKQFKTWENYIAHMDACGFDEFYVCANDNEETQKPRRLSRQMMQSLFALTNDEIDYIIHKSYKKLLKYTRLDAATKIMSEAHKEYENRSNPAKLLSVYPDAIQLDYYKEELNKRYISAKNKAQSGCVDVNGHYLFAISDPYALLDIIIGKKDPADPTIGILKAGECRCNAFNDAKELIALRSPHAFMEWVTLRNIKETVWFPQNCIFFSVHDLTFRVLQMDFDGDHVLVIDDTGLVSIAKRIKRKYKIPVLYYEPTTAPDSGPLPTGKKKFAERIVECIIKCLDLNKVGQYSNFITSAWSRFKLNMTIDEINVMFKHLAIIAAGINHAVDAQKTYSLNKLNYSFTQQYRVKPYNERYASATEEKPAWDNIWNFLTLPAGEGSVDRIALTFDAILPEYASIDTSSLKFDWRMLWDNNPKFIKQVHKCTIPSDIVNLVKNFGKINDCDKTVFADMVANKPVGLASFFHMLWRQNSAFCKEYAETEDDFYSLNEEKDWRFAMIRTFMVRFMKQDIANTYGMSDEDMLRYAAASLLRNTFEKTKKNEKYIGFVLQVFGDIYADVASRKLAEAAESGAAITIEESEPEEVQFSDEYLDPAMVEILESGSFWLSELNDI